MPSPWRALDFWLEGTPWDLRGSAMGLLSFVTPAQLNPFSYNPLRAIDTFVTQHDADWEIDPHYTRVAVTSNPRGYLRRKLP